MRSVEGIKNTNEQRRNQEHGETFHELFSRQTRSSLLFSIGLFVCHLAMVPSGNAATLHRCPKKEDRYIQGHCVHELKGHIQSREPEVGVQRDLHFSRPNTQVQNFSRFMTREESNTRSDDDSLPYVQRQSTTGIQRSTFVADIYNSPSPAHTGAIEYCLDLAAHSWESEVEVTVKVNFSQAGDGLVLGIGQPSLNFVVDDAYICPVALTEAILKKDVNGKRSGELKYDILATFNTATAWYTDWDAQPTSNMFDLPTVCLHEIYHGLFFSGGNIAVSLSRKEEAKYIGTFLRESVVGRFDAFMANQDDCNITAYAKNPEFLGTVLTGNNLWFVSESERIARLHAPRPYTQGSSLYHLSESVYGTSDENNDLMTPALGSAYAQHNIGAIVSRMQELVLNTSHYSGSDACRIINEPEVDNTLVSQSSGSGDRSDSTVGGGFRFRIGDTLVSGWIILGAAAGALMVIIVASFIIRAVVRSSRKKACLLAAEMPKKRITVDGERGGLAQLV